METYIDFKHMRRSGSLKRNQLRREVLPHETFDGLRARWQVHAMWQPHEQLYEAIHDEPGEFRVRRIPRRKSRIDRLEQWRPHDHHLAEHVVQV